MAILDKEKQQIAGERVGGYAKEFSQFTNTCKKMAAARRAISPVQVEKTNELLDNLAEYETETLSQGKPLTVAGYMLASGLNRETFYRVLNGDFDYVIDEYRALHDVPADTFTVTIDNEQIPLIAWREILEKCYLRIQEQLETNCYDTRAKNAAGSIFGLKARFNWHEDDTNAATVKQAIATTQQALASLKLLE